MRAAEVLRAARRLLEKPEAWTQGVWARGKSGKAMLPDNRRAVCWCAMGATSVAAKGDNLAHHWALIALRNALGNDPVAYWNDFPGRTHAEILAGFDRAIEIAEALP